MDIPTYDDWNEPDQLDGGRPKPGDYHCQVIEAAEDEKRVELKFEILSPGSEQGKQFRHWLYFAGKDANATKQCHKHVVATAIRLGLMTKAEFEAAKAAGKNISIDWTQACGCQAIVEVGEEEYQGKMRTKVPFGGVHYVADPDFAHVPLDWTFAALIGVTPENRPRLAAQSPSPAAQTQPPAVPPAAGQSTRAAAGNASGPDPFANPAPMAAGSDLYANI